MTKLKQGDKFIAPEDSVGNSVWFWVNPLSFKIEGSFVKGDVVELKSFVLESNKITLQVERVEKQNLDVVVDTVMFPVSVVGLSEDVEVLEHEDIVHSITSINNENRVYLFLIKIPVAKRKKIRIPLGNSKNIIEYTYEGL